MMSSKALWRVLVGVIVLAAPLIGLIGPESGSASAGSSFDATAAEATAPSAAAAPTAHAGAWSMESDCAGCHTVEGSSQSNSVHLASRHPFPCVTCHQNEASLRTAHADVSKPPTQTWLNTPIDTAVCFSCHEGWQSLSKRTKESRALIDSKGKVVNPHAIPNTPTHNQNPPCHVCHAMHLDPKPVGEYCVGCHHKNVFECNTCHKQGQ